MLIMVSLVVDLGRLLKVKPILGAVQVHALIEICGALCAPPGRT
jgi:hypothetical protein